MPHLQRLRHGGPVLLSVLIATGLVVVGIGGLERNALLFAVGFWLVPSASSC